MNTKTHNPKTLKTFIRVFQRPVLWGDDPSEIYRCALSLKEDEHGLYVDYRWNYAPPTPFEWHEYLQWHGECHMAFRLEFGMRMPRKIRIKAHCDVLTPFANFISKNIK